MRKTLPVAQRVLGASSEVKIRILRSYAKALFEDGDATLDDLCEAVTKLEDAERTARRVFGGMHPLTSDIEEYLQEARAAVRAREAPDDDETVDVPVQEDDADDAARLAALEASITPPPPPTTRPPTVGCAPGCFGRSS